MRKETYTDEQLIQAVAESISIREALSKLGVVPAGGNYQTIKSKISRLGIDTSHFKGQSWNKGKKMGHRRQIEDYLSNRFPINSHRLRLRLIREGFFANSCQSCGLSEWMGRPIPLELEHINGNHLDNDLENLTILCPNCHALTPTYRGKNASSKLGSVLPSP